jgi:URI fold toxin 2
MKKHGNRKDNDAEHHLYKIEDRTYNDVYKYGICGEALHADNTSPRAKRQVKELNRAVRWMRFFATVLRTGISGRIAAQNMEAEYIEQYRLETGKVPPGNQTEED